MYRIAIRNLAVRKKLKRFVTLTLDPKKLKGAPSVPYLNRTFAKLRTLLARKYGAAISYIRILEFQKNGMAHFHLLVDRRIDFDWLQEVWQAVGGGLYVNIKYVDVHRIANYLSKYLTKELLLSAPKRSRRVTTSRSLHLLEKRPKESGWEFLRLPIEALIAVYKNRIVDLAFDADGILTAFLMIPGPLQENV